MSGITKRERMNRATARRMGCAPVSQEEMLEAVARHAARQQAATIRAERRARGAPWKGKYYGQTRRLLLTRGAPLRTLPALLREMAKSPSIWYEPGANGKPMPCAFLQSWQFIMVVRYVNRGAFYRCNRPKAAK